MPLTSDIILDASKFAPESVTEETINVNNFIERATSGVPTWQEVGPVRFREMRERGETGFAAPVYLPAAKDAQIPSRDNGRDIAVRVYSPDNGQASKGLFLHIHGGGFVMGTHQHQDGKLRDYANTFQLTAISVDYRRTPEDPWPAQIHDCFDVAEYLVDSGESAFGSKLLFISGESAGGNLSAETAFHLIRSRPNYQIAGLILLYGWFDVTQNLPMAATFKRPVIANNEKMLGFALAYTPGMTIEERRNPLVSPIYEDMQGLARAAPGGKLPPALFLCGTEDPLLDDTLLMSTKWMIAGSEAIVKIYPGACHAFTAIPGYTAAEEAWDATVQFMREKME
ncbi:Alpha/Beta hydrolase protein [Triangularia verruculosa]|uniref:Alpha/Beta hydrolase protein n=1 Tax=Triangularia verruculosa TaxID=2587418 RepID=A0AAN6XJN3_9PEZI|nr:Alpha/Beta hydrolase protein [Triangularia verruculosa]